jgi:hypothetical protein
MPNFNKAAIKIGRTIVMATAVISGTVGANDYYEKMARLKALDARCEHARLEKLAPIRRQLIEECIEQKRPDYSPQDCEGGYAAYGDSTVGPNMNLIQGQYYDLPECVEAALAWREWELSQPRRVD